MAPHSSTLAWKIPWMEEPGRLQSMGSLRVRYDWVTSLWLFTFLHWKRKWQLHSILAWRIPGIGEPGGLPSMGSHRVGHDWSNLAAAAAALNLGLAKSLTACFVSKVLLEHSHAPLFVNGLWLLLSSCNRDQTANIHWIIKNARQFQKNIYFCFIDYSKAFDCVDHNKLENSERDGNTRPLDLPLEKPVCRSGSNS